MALVRLAPVFHHWRGPLCCRDRPAGPLLRFSLRYVTFGDSNMTVPLWSTTMISAAQIRAARGLLDMPQTELAKLAGFAHRTIKRAERGEPIREETAIAILRVLERRGIEFIAENGGGPGVRLRKRGRK